MAGGTRRNVAVFWCRSPVVRKRCAISRSLPRGGEALAEEGEHTLHGWLVALFGEHRVVGALAAGDPHGSHRVTELGLHHGEPPPDGEVGVELQRKDRAAS